MRVLKILALISLSCTGSIDGRVPTTSSGESSDIPGTEPDSPTTSASPAWLPSRLRRLSNAELDNAVTDLLHISVWASYQKDPVSRYVSEDIRQSGFSVNAASRVDATFKTQLMRAMADVSFGATRYGLSSLVKCGSADKRSCASMFIDTFASRAFRRPIQSDERLALLAVYDAAASPAADAGFSGTFEDGLTAVIQATLESGSFLYVSELGQGDGAVAELDSNEIAATLAFLVSGTLPDQQLMDAAAQGALLHPDQREAHARRLLAGQPLASKQLARFVKQWLRLDTLNGGASRKSPAVEKFQDFIPSILGETDNFVEAIVKDNSPLSVLLSADFTYVDTKLATLYGMAPPSGTGFTRVDLKQTPRRGILSQANFLSTFATEEDTSPVKRGNILLEDLLCLHIRLPSTPELLQLAMTSVPVSSSSTTRERFQQHSSNPACASCHQLIDPLGFGFENFDPAGVFRSKENGRDVDASGVLKGTDVDGPFLNAVELTSKLASSENVRQCYARHFFRFASGQSSDETEAHYVKFWKTLPEDRRSQLVDLVVGYVRSDMFVKRKAQ